MNMRGIVVLIVLGWCSAADIYSLKDSSTSVLRRCASQFGKVFFLTSLSHTSKFNTEVAYAADIPESSLSLKEATSIIKEECQIALNAARNTGRLLYRGIANNNSIAINSPAILNPTYDLINNATQGYYENSPLAADFFSSIDKYMAQQKTEDDAGRRRSQYPVTPRNGHIATADIQMASEWGVPVSVWPLDAGLHYAWLLNDISWWNETSFGSPQGKRGPFFWRSQEILDLFVSQEVRYDRAMEAVMAKGGEILFGNDLGEMSDYDDTNKLRTKKLSKSIAGTREGGFLAVPLKYEPQLLSMLDIVPFSSSTRVRVSEVGMKMDGPPVRRKFNVPVSGW